jgi:hypothetical protein
MFLDEHLANKINVKDAEVLKPIHYKAKADFDVIDFCKAYDLNFNLGNVVKYVSRAGKKGGKVEDLKKAITYLEREIESETVKLPNLYDFLDDN